MHVPPFLHGLLAQADETEKAVLDHKGIRLLGQIHVAMATFSVESK